MHTTEESNLFHVDMRDGIKLSTHVYFPQGKGPWPVIFSRTPYHHSLPNWKIRARFWVQQGYVFIIQECRGTGSSEGEWLPFLNEQRDGLDSLKWIVQQSWMDGNIATYGASYCGVVQWCMAEHFPPEVKTMFISVTGIERYRQNYMNGMFRHDIYTVWALDNSGVAPLDPSKNLYEEALTIRPHMEMDTRLFGTKLPWYRDWITHVDPESHYWSAGLWADLKEIPSNTRVPVMMVAGWFDHNLDASIQSYLKLPEATRRDSVFLIGPWVHTEDVSGDLQYPDHDVFGSGQQKAALEWFDHHLKGKPFGMSKGSVHTYTIGEHRWENRDGWIRPARQLSYFLTATDGQFCTLEQQRANDNTSISFEYNPEEPVQTKGGSALLAYLSGDPHAAPPASVRQDEPGTRADVLTFMSPNVEEDMRIAGSMKAHLFVSSDADDTSFTVTVMEQLPDGTSYNIRDGITSLRFRNGVANEYSPHEVVEAVIELWPITWTVKRGSRLRIDISSSNFPAYHIHPNVAGSWAHQEVVKTAKQEVYVGGDYASWIEIPMD